MQMTQYRAKSTEHTLKHNEDSGTVGITLNITSCLMDILPGVKSLQNREASSLAPSNVESSTITGT